jgi:hypothetical protein
LSRKSDDLRCTTVTAPVLAPVTRKAPRSCPYWDDLERKLSPEEKLNILSKHLCVKIDRSQRPGQTLRELNALRNTLAHGKVLKSTVGATWNRSDGNIDLDTHEVPHWDFSMNKERWARRWRARISGCDVNFAKQMVEFMRTNYCIDNKRIFSVGFSYGAIMSNTVGCQMGDVFRAIAPMSGSGPLSAGQCKGPVAAWIAHGTSDTTVPFSGGQRSRDTWVMKNGCTTMTMPTTPSPCVSYQGCMDGYPVTWCENQGAGHTQPSYGGSAIWKFFAQF